MSEGKRILSCALTGALANRKQCPYLPYTPKEIAVEAKRAYDAGATIVHIHARTDNGAPTWELNTFREIQSEVQALCPVLINFSTGGIEGTIQDRAKSAVELRPHVAAVNMGSMNYGIWSKNDKKFHWDGVFLNPFSEIQWLLTHLRENQIIPELECFDTGHTCNADFFIEMGLLKPPVHFSFIMGVAGGLKATRPALQAQVQLLPEGGEFQVIGIGRKQWELTDWALELGGHVRVGLEDNFYLPDNQTMAKSNGELCETAVQRMQSRGYGLATLEETRTQLGLA